MPIDDEDDDFGGNTMGNYLPSTPRQPAFSKPPCRSRGCLAPLNNAGLCTVHFADLLVRRDVTLAGRNEVSIQFTDLDPLTPTPPELPPPPPIPPMTEACPRCEVGMMVADLPEIAAWSCGHWVRKQPQSIAEAFQDMLRAAYQAGVAAAASGESFESWYQREVLH